MSPTNEQRGEYMRNVKWTTAGIVLSSTISVIVAIVWFCSDIKSDIAGVRAEVKDARTEAREQLTNAVTSVNRRIDSNEYNHKIEMSSVWLILNQQGYKTVKSHIGMYTEKRVFENGKWIIKLVPVN
jgi:hypothetical protein